MSFKLSDRRQSTLFQVPHSISSDTKSFGGGGIRVGWGGGVIKGSLCFDGTARCDSELRSTYLRITSDL